MQANRFLGTIAAHSSLVFFLTGCMVRALFEIRSCRCCCCCCCCFIIADENIKTIIDPLVSPTFFFFFFFFFVCVCVCVLDLCGASLYHSAERDRAWRSVEPLSSAKFIFPEGC